MTPLEVDRHFQSRGFPRLRGVLAKQTSQPDPVYNCIAHAFGDPNNFWWPNGLPIPNATNTDGHYWPIANAGQSVMQAFLDWFAHDGWLPTFDHAFNPERIKIALYVDAQGRPTHAARLIGPDLWTSKLGQHLDLSHGPNDLDGPEYGSVFGVYEKTI